MTEHSTNWKNIDLNSPCERALNLIEPLSFEDFLLEIDCNLPEINEKTVRAQFEEDLQRRIKDARWVFEANLKNLVEYVEEYRNEE